MRVTSPPALSYTASMPTLDDVREKISHETGLATIAVTRSDGSVHASIANVGVLGHPVTGSQVVGVVVRGNAVKLRLARQRRRASVTIRHGWSWVGVEGPVDIFGPDDPNPEVDADGVRLLLRDVFTAAGGTHEDFDEYDRVMLAERRTAILVEPERILGR